MFEHTFADATERDWETDVSGTLRLATVGCGGYARTVSIPAMAAGDHVEPTVVVSGDPDTRAALAAEYDVTALDYEAYEAGVATDEYDAVYVATPNRLHLPHAETAVTYGKHVLCEKPLEATAERAAALVDTCESAGVRLMTAYRMQTDPVVRRLREFIAAGGLGTLQRAHGDFTFPVLGADGDGDPDQWRLDDHLAGGGALMDVGVYPLNTARFLAREAPGVGSDPLAVSAVTRSPDPAFDAVDQHVDFLVEFDGWVGDFSASFSGHANTTLEVLGTDGRVAVRSAFEPGRDREVTVETDAGRLEVSGVGADETVEEFDYFAHAVLADEPIEPDGTDGLTDVRTASAVYESADTGERVAVDATR